MARTLPHEAEPKAEYSGSGKVMEILGCSEQYEKRVDLNKSFSENRRPACLPILSQLQQDHGGEEEAEDFRLLRA
jgi:hypothetical protein